MPPPAWPYREIWAADFEFMVGAGERPVPVCLCAREVRSGREVRLWQDEFGQLPPYPTGAHSLFVAYYASAELGCHLALGWSMPERILDPFAEFRCRTNGLETPAGVGIIGALTAFGLDAIGATEKQDMRDLVMRGGPWTDDERAAILDYCMSDADALARLLPAMAPGIDLPRALLRGRYMAAAARMEFTGVPIDVEMLRKLRKRWTSIQDKLIKCIDADYGVYEGRTFKRDRFEAWLVWNGIPWPRLESGQLDMGDDTFRQMARCYPAVSPLRELRSSLADLRLNDLEVGHDGRNRIILSAFRARTGRNQPSNSKFIFGPSVWIRSLIKPGAGRAVAYIDYGQQEFAIAAKLSGDRSMAEAYASGDPYLTFAKQAGAIPPEGTKETHAGVRELFKTTALGVLYGMEAEGLALRLDQPSIIARDLLRAHHETYRQFWRWSDAVVDHAKLTGKLHTCFGWALHGCCGANPRSLRNFQMQAHGAEMLRLACCMATERGIQVCAPVHDALLIEAPIDEVEMAVAVTRELMAEASRIVLGDFEVRTDVKIIRYPERFNDPRGTRMWEDAIQSVEEAAAEAGWPVAAEAEHRLGIGKEVA